MTDDKAKIAEMAETIAYAVANDKEAAAALEKALNERDEAHQELERRTAWSNDQIAQRDRRIDELATIRARLERELRDAEAMVQAQIEVIQEAARLLHDVLYERGCSADPAVTAWLSRALVKAAGRSSGG